MRETWLHVTSPDSELKEFLYYAHIKYWFFVSVEAEHTAKDMWTTGQRENLLKFFAESEDEFQWSAFAYKSWKSFSTASPITNQGHPTFYLKNSPNELSSYPSRYRRLVFLLLFLLWLCLFSLVRFVLEMHLKNNKKSRGVGWNGFLLRYRSVMLYRTPISCLFLKNHACVNLLRRFLKRKTIEESRQG